MSNVDWHGIAQTVGFASLAALCGGVARSRLWFFPDDFKRPDGTPDPRAGHFNLRRCLTEISSTVAIGLMCGGVGQMWSLHIMVIAGMAAMFGLVGGAVIGEVAEMAVRGRVARFIDGSGK
jgi:hypothetical protein